MKVDIHLRVSALTCPLSTDKNEFFLCRSYSPYDSSSQHDCCSCSSTKALPFAIATVAVAAAVEWLSFARYFVLTATAKKLRPEIVVILNMKRYQFSRLLNLMLSKVGVNDKV